MFDINEFRDMMFDVVDGIISRFRNGDERISDDEMKQIDLFAESFNEHLRNNTITTTEICIAIEMVYLLGIFKEVYPSLSNIIAKSVCVMLSGMEY